MTKYHIPYEEGSDYGQELLQILGLVGSLMEEDKEYTKKEVLAVCYELSGMIRELRNNVKKGDCIYFTEDGAIIV